jgi:AICAR transformylase/IMP cyclohydrolase PurH
LTLETASFFNRPDMFFEGMMAPEYEEGTADMLKNKHKNRFLMQTGYLTGEQLNVFGCNLQPVVSGQFLKQSPESPYDVRREAVVVTGNQGNTNIESLDAGLLADINFAGNAAIYLASNLVFFVYNGAVAGLGDGCGARTVAAKKARDMLEISAYAALSAGTKSLWDRVLFDTPYTRQDFERVIPMPLSLVAFSDAFYPKLDGFVETAGIDRVNRDFQEGRVQYKDRIGGVDQLVTFVPKKDNYAEAYDRGLIPAVVVQPGGSLGDKVVNPIAENFGVKMVFTMTPAQYDRYLSGEKGVTGRRFFGHIIMSP